MSTAQTPVEVSKEQLARDLKVLVADAEALLKATASQSGEADGSTTCGTDGSFAAAACVGKACTDMPVAHTSDGTTSCSGQVHQSTHSTMDSNSLVFQSLCAV